MPIIDKERATLNMITARGRLCSRESSERTSIGSLSKEVLERRTATESEAFSL